MLCAADKSQTCGGPWANQVYELNPGESRALRK